jgi:predicted GIY-YIG superfamily endonuclease
MGRVYLLTNNNDQYKIGITKHNAKKRIKTLQTGNGDIIDIVAEFKSKYNNKIEGALHRRYGTKRLKGEWFQLEKKDIQNFTSECQLLHDNFKLLEESGNPFI